MSEDLGNNLSRAIDILKRSQKMLGPVLQSFDDRVSQFGADPRSAYWKNEEWQRRRYDILSTLFAPEDRQGGITITDYGCGYGAFFDYLKDRPVMSDSRYIGIDISQAMIDEAEVQIQDPRTEFQRHLIATGDTDYTFVCGTYNLNLGADEGEWMEYIQASLEQLWSKTRKALGFNLLRSDAPEKYAGLYYADGKMFEDFCREKLSPDVTYSDDSPLPDWTIFVRR